MKINIYKRKQQKKLQEIWNGQRKSRKYFSEKWKLTKIFSADILYSVAKGISHHVFRQRTHGRRHLYKWVQYTTTE